MNGKMAPGYVSSSSAASSADLNLRLRDNQERDETNKVTSDGRLLNARKWIIIVESYYIVRASFIIFPMFSEETPF